MANQGDPHVVTRRNAIKATGAAVVGSALAGCSGRSNSSSNGSTTSESGSGGGTTTNQTTSKPSYHATVPEAALELGTMPHMAAVREIMPSNTDKRMTGEIRRFDNVRLMITALNAGSVDTYTNAPANLYYAQAAGNDYRIIAPKVLGTDYYIVGHKDKAPTLKSFDQNSDLTFAINQPGNIDYLQVVGVFDKKGLDFTKVSTVSVGGSSSRIKAFLSDRAQGFTCHVGQFQRLKSQGKPVKLLAKVSDYFPQFVQSCVAVPAKSLNDPTFEQWTQSYVNALLQANKKATNNFDWIFNVAQKYQAEPLNKQEAKASWDNLTQNMHAWRYDSFKKEPFQAVLKMLTSSNQLNANIDLDKMWEPKYAKKAMAQL